MSPFPTTTPTVAPGTGTMGPEEAGLWAHLHSSSYGWVGGGAGCSSLVGFGAKYPSGTKKKLAFVSAWNPTLPHPLWRLVCRDGFTRDVSAEVVVGLVDEDGSKRMEEDDRIKMLTRAKKKKDGMLEFVKNAILQINECDNPDDWQLEGHEYIGRHCRVVRGKGTESRLEDGWVFAYLPPGELEEDFEMWKVVHQSGTESGFDREDYGGPSNKEDKTSYRDLLEGFVAAHKLKES